MPLFDWSNKQTPEERAEWDAWHEEQELYNSNSDNDEDNSSD